MKYQDSQFFLSASDLMNFAGCSHLTELDRKVQLGELKKPDWLPPNLKLLQEKGYEHEAAYVEFLKNKGLSIFECTNQSNEASKTAMMEGYDIITQAYISRGKWRGKLDILRKVNGKSNLGNYHYVVEDTKLATETKATTVLQLCLYNDILFDLQGLNAEYMYVVKPGEDFPTDEFRYDDFKAYYNQLKNRFETVIDNPPESTYPNPVSKCNTCAWWRNCDSKRHEDDHLSLIAGAAGTQVKELEQQGFKTLENYAGAKSHINEKPKRGNEDTYKKLHSQAKIQMEGRIANKIKYKLLNIEKELGLNKLPKTTPGDVYFDIEGDRYFEGNGIEYLFGYTLKNRLGKFEYHHIWAKSRAEEKKAFEKFMDFLMEQWKKYPGFHVYHYAPYEPSAIKQLSSRFGCKEDERDRLLRGGRFIDLLSLTKQTLQASVESYSLKDVEKLTGYTREAILQDAAAARRRISTSFELSAIHEMPKEDFELIEMYNKDDCIATGKLHLFLEAIYQDEKNKGRSLSRPELKSGELEDEKIKEKDIRSKNLFEKLVKDLPEDPAEWNEEEKVKWLLAHQVDFFRREEKAKYWEYFRLLELGPENYLEEKNVIVGLELKRVIPPKSNKSTSTHVYSFTEQMIDFKSGDAIVGFDSQNLGTVVEMNSAERCVTIKKPKKLHDYHPFSFFKDERRTDSRNDYFLNVVGELASKGIENNKSLKPLCDLLLKKNPDIENSNLQAKTLLEMAIQKSKGLQNSYLPIQGPPGTGKTHTAAKIILELIKENKKIGVTALSHHAIRNLIDKVIELAKKENQKVQLCHKNSPGEDELPEELELASSNDKALKALSQGKIVGATTYLWCRDEAIDALDYLFIDEAGQLSLSAVVAVGRSAKNIILLGDPQQLTQPQQGSHPEESGISALEYILGGEATLKDDRGVFLGITYRLPPSICDYTSKLFYEGRLKSIAGLENQKVIGNGKFSGEGLKYIPVQHEGNQSYSPEELEVVVNLYNEIKDSKLQWKDREGKEMNIGVNDILIMAPFNAQVNELQKKLKDARIGTVDKFQGQEAPIVIYSMTSSSPEDAPRGLSFLYDSHRLNVASSRAQCICILVSSPKLFEAECNSVDQMKLVNGLCFYSELAEIIG